jgi:hypothetical protein
MGSLEPFNLMSVLPALEVNLAPSWLRQLVRLYKPGPDQTQTTDQTLLAGFLLCKLRRLLIF